MPQAAITCAEDYDGELKDIFALQDSVTQKIVTALSPQFAAGEESLSRRPETASIEARDLLLRGLAVTRTRCRRDSGVTSIASQAHLCSLTE